MYYQLNELLRKLKRGPQVMLPKDIGVVLAYTGVGRNSFCVDAGAGSGWLACSLGNVAKKVVSYEWRPEFVELARANAQRAGLENVRIKKADVFKGIKEKRVDLVTLDLANSDRVVPSAAKALREGGYLFGYCPHVEQVKKFVRACTREKMRNLFVIECMVREMLVRKEGMRPETKGLTHTAYLVFAQK